MIHRELKFELDDALVRIDIIQVQAVAKITLADAIDQPANAFERFFRRETVGGNSLRGELRMDQARWSGQTAPGRANSNSWCTASPKRGPRSG